MNYDEETINKFTPMMQQYLNIKKDYTNAIVFFRLGDFYEMFFEDALLASRELEIALTGRDAGQEEKVPMCGIPFHAYESYANKLVENGHRVAIVEQVEDPSVAKGIVKRDVIKILTPGTLVDSGLEEKENNFVCSIGKVNKDYLLVSCDISTGESTINLYNSLEVMLQDIISIHSKEVVICDKFIPNELLSIQKNYQIMISKENNGDIAEYLEYVVENVQSEYRYFVGILLNYLISTQKTALKHLKKTLIYQKNDYLKLDSFTKRNLELLETLRGGQRKGSLLAHLDKCQTAMGSRMLAKWLHRPLIDESQINKRLDFVESFNENYLVKEEIKESLKSVYDLERILARLSCGNVNAKDLVWLRRSLENVPNIKSLIYSLNTKIAEELADGINTHKDLFELLTKALVDNPPFTVKEGHMFRDGYNSDLDELRSISTNSKDWIVNFESQERERLGIPKLKIGYNRIFGYYIEVPKKFVPELPEDIDYKRKQTVASGERYITPKLKEYENIVTSSKDKIEQLEYELFSELRIISSKYIQTLQDLADKLSYIDVLISFSEISTKYNYVRPTFNKKKEVSIVNGRHPVLETLLKDEYVKNDVFINSYNMVVITGPNMSGKSTYMKEFALIVILAQIGCFVPADSCSMYIFDAIYTRIGASDDLLSGQSTFMVEMVEARYAIKNATKNSLILFDELGRGTATFDGMALAQAIIEYIHESLHCATLFSTHYHELVTLENHLNHLKNVHVEASEEKSGIVFLHKVKQGPSDKSYGINVASLARMPKSIIKRSKDILDSLEENANIKENMNDTLFSFKAFDEKPEVKKQTLGDEIVDSLKEINLDNLTPLESLNILAKLKERVD